MASKEERMKIIQVWEANQEGSGTWTVGGQIKSIELKRDGYGISGHYDRIHIYDDKGGAVILPAWACAWVVEETEPDHG